MEKNTKNISLGLHYAMAGQLRLKKRKDLLVALEGAAAETVREAYPGKDSDYDAI